VLLDARSTISSTIVKSMSLRSQLLRLLGRTSQDREVDQYGQAMEKAAERLADVRGERITALPADSDPTSSENVHAAAKDYGVSRFSGETDALGAAADGYRSSTRKNK
jgi:hypothetical protein